MIIYLDMDGVLCNFVGGAARLFNKDPELVTHWGIEQCWGMSEKEMWDRIHEERESFWANLDPFPWTDDLIFILNYYYASELYICTTPSLHPTALSGKLEWIQKHLPADLHRRYVMTKHKELLAYNRTEKCLLVDDSDNNISKFRGAGGHTALFPQPWNANRGIIDQRIKTVTESIKAVI